MPFGLLVLPKQWISYRKESKNRFPLNIGSEGERGDGVMFLLFSLSNYSGFSQHSTPFQDSWVFEGLRDGDIPDCRLEYNIKFESMA